MQFASVTGLIIGLACATRSRLLPICAGIGGSHCCMEGVCVSWKLCKRDLVWSYTGKIGACMGLSRTGKEYFWLYLAQEKAICFVVEGALYFGSVKDYLFWGMKGRSSLVEENTICFGDGEI